MSDTADVSEEPPPLDCDAGSDDQHGVLDFEIGSVSTNVKVIDASADPTSVVLSDHHTTGNADNGTHMSGEHLPEDADALSLTGREEPDGISDNSGDLAPDEQNVNVPVERMTSSLSESVASNGFSPSQDIQMSDTSNDLQTNPGVPNCGDGERSLHCTGDNSSGSLDDEAKSLRAQKDAAADSALDVVQTLDDNQPTDSNLHSDGELKESGLENDDDDDFGDFADFAAFPSSSADTHTVGGVDSSVLNNGDEQIPSSHWNQEAQNCDTESAEADWADFGKSDDQTVSQHSTRKENDEDDSFADFSDFTDFSATTGFVQAGTNDSVPSEAGSHVHGSITPNTSISKDAPSLTSNSMPIIPPSIPPSEFLCSLIIPSTESQDPEPSTPNDLKDSNGDAYEANNCATSTLSTILRLDSPPPVASSDESDPPVDEDEPSVFDAYDFVKMWRQLRTIEEAISLRYRWKGCLLQERLLEALGINPLALKVSNPNLPAFARHLGTTLVPTKWSGTTSQPPSSQQHQPSLQSQTTGAGSRKSSTGSLNKANVNSSVVNHSKNVQPVQEIQLNSLAVEPAEFDWASSGLSNPLSHALKKDLASLGLSEDSPEKLPHHGSSAQQQSSSVYTGPSSQTPGAPPRLLSHSQTNPGARPAGTTTPQSARQLASKKNSDPTTAAILQEYARPGRGSKRSGELQPEIATVCDQLPDVSYMLSPVLMFPISEDR